MVIQVLQVGYGLDSHLHAPTPRPSISLDLDHRYIASAHTFLQIDPCKFPSTACTYLSVNYNRKKGRDTYLLHALTPLPTYSVEVRISMSQLIIDVSPSSPGRL